LVSSQTNKKKFKCRLRRPNPAPGKAAQSIERTIIGGPHEVKSHSSKRQKKFLFFSLSELFFCVFCFCFILFLGFVVSVGFSFFSFSSFLVWREKKKKNRRGVAPKV